MFSKKWNPDGKHVYITGGSTGLGLSLAQLLTKKGAHVSIVARNQDKLDKALASLEELRVNPSQILKAYSHSLDTASASTEALEAACHPFEGQAPDAVVTCAGGAAPGFFVELEEKDLFNGMQNNYWVQAWTAWAAAKKMAQQKKKGSKIVLVSSTLGLMSMLGWASYAPAKHALRGLADTLHSEMMLYGVSVSIFFPPTMSTPGLDQENKTKPAIVWKIEEGDGVLLTADQAAVSLWKGIEKGDAHITADFSTSLFRASGRGAMPRNNWILDGLYDFVAYIAVPFWRAGVDNQVRGHIQEHEEYLGKKGFYA
ncbi:oxidoreductase [Crepidotus variabilis]|uniref:3-dehydrosphinganine reductase n=1 Tax=Crepidotus variabilis TaxID=179855 RepID=A0A9P6EBB3_9AGAR|nr:oxidoreductase [Crepidotus variabilis]